MSVGTVIIGGGSPLAFIAGPCVIESAAHALEMATAIRDIAARAGVPVIFKASYDKANRTSRHSFRGPGLDEGLRILSDVKATTGLPILTDIHEPAHAAMAAQVVDVLQIPAFLSRQTDLLVAAARTGKTVNVKKGQFLSPRDVRHVIDKITGEGNTSVLVTERGVSFGYNNLVVDMRAFPMLRELGHPVVFDVTHSLQLPGAGDGVTAGLAEYIEPLASAGVAAGVDAVFMEVHEEPARAKSDAANALRLDKLEALMLKLTRIDAAARNLPAPRSKPARSTRGDDVIAPPVVDLMLARKVLQTEAAAILALVDRLGESFERAVRLLLDCKGRVIVTGMGKSGIICRKIAATLSSTGTPAFFLHPAEAIHGDLGVLQAEDVILALSYSGETDELLRLLETIKRLGASLVVMTGDCRSTLGQAADVALDCSVSEEACPMNLVPTASTTAALALGDALAMTLLVAKGFSQEHFASLHPGGKLGKRLMRVEQLMHGGDQAPIVSADTPMPQVIYEISSKGLGMTCVVDGQGALTGIITDGDLRRHMTGTHEPARPDRRRRDDAQSGYHPSRHAGRRSAAGARAAQDHLDCRRQRGQAGAGRRAPAQPLAHRDVLTRALCHE